MTTKTNFNLSNFEGNDRLSFLDNYRKADVDKVLNIVHNNTQNDDIFSLAQDFLKLLAEKDKLCYFDKMTNCTNRNSYEALLDDIKNCDSDKYNKVVNVYLADGESFKKANDSLGYEKGDFIIESIGKNAINFLKKFNNSLHSIDEGCTIENMSKFDFVCRLGGDEFFIISSEYLNTEELRNACCVKTSEIFNVDFDINVSLGHAFGTLKDLEKLIRVAEKNMKDDKKNRGAQR